MPLSDEEDEVHAGTGGAPRKPEGNPASTQPALVPALALAVAVSAVENLVNPEEFGLQVRSCGLAWRA